MKKILGLDLGVGSIGWALITDNENPIENEILGIGCRIIPYSATEDDDFTKGTGESKCQKRTAKRTMRKTFDRYQLRRFSLTRELIAHNMLPEKELFSLSPLELYGLREKALFEQISLPGIGRIFFHLNQKRGYKHARSDESSDKKQTEYVTEVNSRYDNLKEKGCTVGQFFLEGLKQDNHYRIKDQVFPRRAYEEEFDRIWSKQQEYYPNVLTNELYQRIKNEIIFHQRPLKSCKHLINICEFEGVYYKNSNGKDVFSGPKVAPKTSPLSQVCKIWESINNIKLKNRRGVELILTREQKQILFDYLDNNDKLTSTDLRRILQIPASEGYTGGPLLAKGLQGNLTKIALKKAINNKYEEKKLLDFNLNSESFPRVDKATGELLTRKKIIADFESQNLYRLWHIAYSLKEKVEIASALKKQFDIEDDELVEALYKIDFVKAGFGNKSSKAMRMIIPYLQEGFMYSEACTWAGYNHSNSITSEQNLQRPLADQLKILSKNALRQPIVEKILNQMIHLVNEIIQKYGRPDEIRVELARELKQSKDERNSTFLSNSKTERENNTIADQIRNEFGLPGTRKQIEKWRFFKEISGDEAKINATCLYCGQNFGLSKALNGEDVEVEHIIPRSLFFDDSKSNKTLTHRSCNMAKGNLTAFDFMKNKSETEFNDYLERVEQLYKNKMISRAKHDRLLMSQENIPNDFITRQLRESAFISRKAREILMQVCRDVTSTSGSVTASLRKLWGWEDILMNLQMDKYRLAGQTEMKTIEHAGQIHEQERILNWTKRDDQRHHAIDALTIACTKQKYIQNLNTLNSKQTREEMFAETQNQSEDYKKRLSQYERWIQSQYHFSTNEVSKAVAGILISYKPGKKVASYGRRIKYIHHKAVVMQKGILVPRGQLSEESVYGKIKALERNVPVQKLFDNPGMIVKKNIRKLVEDRLMQNEGDVKKAIQSLKKEPIFLDEAKSVELKYGSIYKDELVIKYPIGSITQKDLQYVVDGRLKAVLKERIDRFGEKEAFKNLENNPIYLDEKHQVPVRTVRCFAKLDIEKVAIVSFNDNHLPIGFVKPGNNHHIAIYKNAQGKLVEHVVTFWNAVERKKYGIPVVIKNPAKVWQEIGLRQMPEKFLTTLPENDWVFQVSMQQNEMFVFGHSREELADFIQSKSYDKISKYLYRVQKIATRDYYFRHHLETTVENKKSGGDTAAGILKKFLRICSLNNMLGVKVIINRLGEIVKIGE